MVTPSRDLDEFKTTLIETLTTMHTKLQEGKLFFDSFCTIKLGCPEDRYDYCSGMPYLFEVIH
jgi:hypothetical protein